AMYGTPGDESVRSDEQRAVILDPRGRLPVGRHSSDIAARAEAVRREVQTDARPGHPGRRTPFLPTRTREQRQAFRHQIERGDRLAAPLEPDMWQARAW